MKENKKKDKWAFIINPVAGNGKSLAIETELNKQITKRNILSESALTERKDHAHELAISYAKDSFKYVVAIGGDGTLNEVASALIDYPDVILGLIPAGTGNDFSQIPGLAEPFQEKDWDSLFSAKTHTLDVGRCNGNLFFNGMGLGFDAQVAAENYEEPDKVKQGGKSKYIWHILKNLLFFKEQKMKINSNASTKENICFLNTISIGRRFAGDFYLTPKAFADDGLLDVCMVHKLNLLERINILTKVPKGEHLDHSKVTYYQTDKLIIDIESKVAYHLDGELYFDTHFEIDILPAKLNIIYNPTGNHYFQNK